MRSAFGAPLLADQVERLPHQWFLGHLQWRMSTVTPVTPGSQRETRVRCDLSRLQDTWISLEETLMNTVRLFAFVAAALITTFLFSAVS